MDKEDFDSYFKKISSYKQNIGLIFYNRKLSRKTFKYEEIIEASTSIRNIFKTYKISENVRIGLGIKSSPEIVPIILGILRAKNVFCPINFKENLEHLLSNLVKLKAEYIILSTEIKHSSFILKNDFKVFQTHFYIYLINGRCWSSETNGKYCYCITTSGTTGDPKIITVPWCCIWPNIKHLSEVYNIQNADIILPTSPPTFDPFVLDIFLALYNGAALFFTSNIVNDLSTCYQEIFSSNKDQFGVTIMQITPSIFKSLSEDAVKFLLCGNVSLRILTFGGEPFPFSYLKWFQNDGILLTSLKTTIFNIYGITEVSCWASIQKINDMENLSEISIGKAIDSNTIFEIRSCDTFKSKNANFCGELYVGSKIRKCLVDKEIDSKIFEPEKVIFRNTGDVVENIGGEIFYRGRTNSIVKRFGHRINTSVIENRFLAEPGIRNVCCVFDEMKHDLVIFIEANKEFNPQICINKLKTIAKPNKIILLNRFPVNHNGKIARDILLQNYQSNPENFQYFSFSISDSFDVIIKYISNLLKFSPDVLKNLLQNNKSCSKKLKTALDSSFLSLGGTSIDILNLVNEIETIQQHHVDPKIMEMLFDNNCPLQEILRHIRDLNKNVFITQGTSQPIEDYSVNLNVVWKFNTKKCVDASPTFHEDYITVGSHSHLLANLNHKNGNVISILNLSDRIESQVTFYKETNCHHGVFGCYDGYLYKFDPISGCIANKFHSGGMIKSKCLVTEKFVLFGNYNDKENVFCLNKKDLSLKWALRLGNKGIFSSPILLDENFILICTLDGTVASLNLESGKEQWHIKYAYPVFSTSTFIRELSLVLLSEVNGTLHLVSMQGIERSSFNADGNIFSSFQIQNINNQILAYFGCYDYNLYCVKIEENSIKLVKKIKLQSSIYSTPKLISVNSRQLVVSCSSVGVVNILDTKLESVIKFIKLNGEIFSSPTFVDDKLYIGCRDNHLYCIEIRISKNKFINKYF